VLYDRFYGSDGLLLGYGNEPLREAVKAFQALCPQVASRTIHQALNRSIVSLFESRNVTDDTDLQQGLSHLDGILETLDSEAVIEESNRLLKSLKDKVKEWTAFVLLEGLVLKGLPEVDMGGAVLYAKEHGPLVDSLDNLDVHKIGQQVSATIKGYAERCQCYPTVDVCGGSRFADDLAFQKAQGYVDILKLYAVTSRDRASLYQSIGIIGQPSFRTNPCILKQTPPVIERAEKPRYSWFERSSPVRPYEISREELEHWNEYRFAKMAEIFKSLAVEPGSARSRIQRAVGWYGRAMTAYTNEERFVCLTTALESLLAASEDVSTTQRLSDMVSAFLGGDFDSREHYRQKTRHLYRRRCDIVHTGGTISNEELFDFNTIVTNTIVAFVQREDTLDT
jgi:hypothetical protein